MGDGTESTIEKNAIEKSVRRNLQAGNIYSFRTSPITEFSPQETNRYAALKILGFIDGRVCFVVLDGIFDRHPKLDQVSALAWLTIRRDPHWQIPRPAWCTTPKNWKCDLEDLHFVGSVNILPEEAALVPTCPSIGHWIVANAHAEGEWRWRNDRTAFAEEIGRAKQVRNERVAAERDRYEKRLKSLTWEQILEESLLPRWNEHPPFPPPDFVAAARDRLRSTIAELQSLGPKPKKAQVRVVLKACVDWFNRKDAEFGQVIETEEREDICTVLEEFATVAGQRSLVAEIDAWREW
jgi:hypothetical protein